jgi:Tol biopolymer transport system component
VKTETRNSVSYLGADWGPDGDTIYFLKQVAQPQGNSIWFCRMNWDGSQKQEIAEMWPGQNPYIDTQSGPIWMEVNPATSNAAIGVEYGMGTVGIWVIGLDGKDLHKPFEPVWNDKEKERVLHPSWSPDGSQLVYCKDDRELGIFDFKTKKRRQLTHGIRDLHPVWSPRGDWIVFTHYTNYTSSHGDRYIWLIKPDGSEQEPVTDENNNPVRGWWPSWSPDDNRISLFNGILVIASPVHSKIDWIDTGPAIGGRSPWLLMGHHWGRRGWLICPGQSITLLEADRKKARLLAASGSHGAADGIQWGIEPVDLKGKGR